MAHSAWRAGALDEFSIWLGPDGRDQFGPPAHAGFGHYQVRTADTLIETLRTHSNYLIGDPGMSDEKLAAIRRYLASRPETRSGEFRLPLYTRAVRVVRLAAGPPALADKDLGHGQRGVGGEIQP